MKANILKLAKRDGPSFTLTPDLFSRSAALSGSLEKPFENFLGTGNLPSRTGLGLMQSTVSVGTRGLRRDLVYLSLLTNSALVYKCGGGGACGVSANEYSCANHVKQSLN